MWLTDIKIAIIEKSTDQIESLLGEAPTFENKQDMEEAMYLLREAAELLHRLKDETADSMKQIQKNLDFLKVTQHRTPNTLDIRS